MNGELARDENAVNILVSLVQRKQQENG